jgi:hypothetical protein
MTMFVDFGQRERDSYFRDHGECLLNGHAKLIAALEDWAVCRKRCGANEKPGITVETYVADWLDTIDGSLPEEVREWIGPG